MRFIGPVAWDEWSADLPAFRLRVWREAGLVPRGSDEFGWTDEHDALALHWVVVDETGLLGAARLSFRESRVTRSLGLAGWRGPFATLERLVVRSDARGRGLSRQLDEVRLGAAVERRARTLAVETHGERAKVLRRLGFEVVRELLPDEVPFEPPIPLVLMPLVLMAKDLPVR